jgi:hypothetical protein
MSTEHQPHPHKSEETRKTVDLCGHEYAGARCTRQRGHDGQHACLYRAGAHWLRWD